MKNFLKEAVIGASLLVSPHMAQAEKPHEPQKVEQGIDDMQSLSREQLLKLLRADDFTVRKAAQVQLFERDKEEMLHTRTQPESIQTYRTLQDQHTNGPEPDLDFTNHLKAAEHAALDWEKYERPWQTGLQEGHAELPTDSLRSYLMVLSKESGNPIDYGLIDEDILSQAVVPPANAGKLSFWEVIDNLNLANGTKIIPKKSTSGRLYLVEDKHNKNTVTANTGAVQAEMHYFPQTDSPEQLGSFISFHTEPHAQVYEWKVHKVETKTSEGRVNVGLLPKDAQRSGDESDRYYLDFAKQNNPNEEVYVELTVEMEIIVYDDLWLDCPQPSQEAKVGNWDIKIQESRMTPVKHSNLWMFRAKPNDVESDDLPYHMSGQHFFMNKFATWQAYDENNNILDPFYSAQHIAKLDELEYLDGTEFETPPQKLHINLPRKERISKVLTFRFPAVSMEPPFKIESPEFPE